MSGCGVRPCICPGPVIPDRPVHPRLAEYEARDGEYRQAVRLLELRDQIDRLNTKAVRRAERLAARA